MNEQTAPGPSTTHSRPRLLPSTRPASACRPSPETRSFLPGSLGAVPWGHSGGGRGGREKPCAPAPRGREARGRAAASSLTDWVALRLSLHPRVCSEGSHQPGPAQQISQKMVECFASTGRSGASPMAERRGSLGAGVPGAKRGRGRRPVPEARPRSTRPAHRHGPRTAALTAPRGAARARGSGSGLAAVQPVRGRRQQRPRRLAAAGRPGRGRGFLLFFPPRRRAPHLPLPASRDPHPEPGPGPPGSWWGAAGRRPTSLQNGRSGGPGLPPAPNLFTRRRKNLPPDTRPVQGLTLVKPFQFSVARFPYPCFLPVS